MDDVLCQLIKHNWWSNQYTASIDDFKMRFQKWIWKNIYVIFSGGFHSFLNFINFSSKVVWIHCRDVSRCNVCGAIWHGTNNYIVDVYFLYFCNKAWKRIWNDRKVPGWKEIGVNGCDKYVYKYLLVFWIQLNCSYIFIFLYSSYKFYHNFKTILPHFSTFCNAWYLLLNA